METETETTAPAPRRQVTPSWSIALEPYFRQNEQAESVVLGARGRTIWVDGWATPAENDRQATLAWLKEQASPERRDLLDEERDGVARFAYLLHEVIDGKPRWGMYAFAVNDDGYLQLAIYFDDEQHLAWAKEVAASAQPTKTDTADER